MVGKLIVLCVLSLDASLHAQDPREIVRRSVERDQSNRLALRDYTWTVFQSIKGLNKEGAAKFEETDKWETLMLDGEPHHRNLEKNGKPLSPADQRKQQQKLDEALAKLQRETPSQRRRRLAQAEKQRRDEHAFLLEIPDAYTLELQGDATIDGHSAWVIAAKRNPDYVPRISDAKVLRKVQGKVWIDKTELQWVRLEIESTDTLSFGLFLARLAPGAKVLFEQTRINDELWVPKHMMITGTARLALLKNITIQQEMTWSDYKKFRVDSKMVEGPR